MKEWELAEAPSGKRKVPNVWVLLDVLEKTKICFLG
jgi:hypothetical protein